MPGAERGEHRAQGVVDGQDVGEAAAGGQRQDGLPGQAVLREQVEEGLEQPGVRGLVDRRRDDQAVGFGDGLQGAADLRLTAPGGEQVGGGQGAHGQVRGLEPGMGQAPQHVIGDDLGAGVGGGAAGEGEQLGRHGVLRSRAWGQTEAEEEAPDAIPKDGSGTLSGLIRRDGSPSGPTGTSPSTVTRRRVRSWSSESSTP